MVHDPDTVQVDKLMRQDTSSHLIVPLESLSKLSDHTDTVISVLPNDKVLQSVVSTLALAPGALHSKDAACEKSIDFLRHTAAGLQSFGTELGAANVNW